jgi:hypothetical protein
VKKIEEARESHLADIEELFGSTVLAAGAQAARRAARPAAARRHLRGLLSMSHAFSSLDELGDGYGFRKIRKALGVDRVRRQRDRLSAGYEGRALPRHAGRAVLRAPGPRPRRRRRRDARARRGRALPRESTTPRRISNAGDEDAIVFVVGGKGGYVERDGHLVERGSTCRAGRVLG